MEDMYGVEGTLKFTNADSTMAGIYQCFAKNEYGVSSSVIFDLIESRLESFPYQQSQVGI